MFSFHKPKIYRSNNGCCICKAKSSSSRFTDSKKYENEFERCFLIKGEIRTGEICNACVLLVKRCKKLPKETTKNWAHVVDARAGHKSNNKAKSLSQNNNNSATDIVSSPSRSLTKQTKPTVEHRRTERKICEKVLYNGRSMIANENESNNVLAMSNEDQLKIVRSTSTANANECTCSNCAYNRGLDESEKTSSPSIRRLKKTLTPKKLCTESTSNSSSGNSSDSNDDEDYLFDDEKISTDKMVTRSVNSSSAMHSYASVDESKSQSEPSTSKTSTKSKKKRKFAVKHMQRNESTFLDMNYWRREEVCCGIIFRNKSNDMVLIDSKLFTPCACRKKIIEQQKAIEETKLNEFMDINMEVEIGEELVIDESTDKNNNFLSNTSMSSKDETNEMTEKMNINLEHLNTSTDDQLNDSINNPINELVAVNLNSSSGISSDSSDISSITEEEEEDSNSSSNNLISDHNLIAKNMITKRTFGVL